MQVLFDHSSNESPTVKTFYFRPVAAFRYEAGQFIDLTIPGVGRRYFTLSSCPEEPLLAITTTFRQQPSDFKQAMLELEPGEKLQVSEPMGDFVLPLDASRKLTFVIGGIGVTPVRSICQHLIATKQKRGINIFYSYGQATNPIFKDVLDNFSVIYKQSSINGRISSRDIIKLARPAQNDLIYISGPEKMVESLRASLIDQKINADQIVGDYFNGY